MSQITAYEIGTRDKNNEILSIKELQNKDTLLVGTGTEKFHCLR